uniref:Endonuclease/exonuclease/phosphatase domain-containing protein n=1 Tax=Xiphophorus maculatus TaxID=8083 RepID=A0A3B5QT67_XIPMA
VFLLLNNRTINIEKIEIIMDGRVLLIDMEKNGCKIRIINVYGSTDMQERVLLLQTLQYYICNGRHVIIGGDFNCNLEKRIGNTSACLTNRVDLSSQALNNLIKDCKLTDVYRSLHSEDQKLYLLWPFLHQLSRCPIEQ